MIDIFCLGCKRFRVQIPAARPKLSNSYGPSTPEGLINRVPTGSNSNSLVVAAVAPMGLVPHGALYREMETTWIPYTCGIGIDSGASVRFLLTFVSPAGYPL